MVAKHFSDMTLTYDLLTSKSIGDIRDSRETLLASIMIIGAKQAIIWSRNHFKSSESYDLDLWISKLIGVMLD